MATAIYFKTPAGLQEIQDRALRLHPRIRSLLVMIDGKQSSDSLLTKLSPMGVTADMLQTLADMGLIGAGAAAPASAAQAAAQATPASAPVSAAQADALQALYGILDTTIRGFGMRGFRLQLQLEKAASLDDYRALARAVIAALDKTKGEVALSDFMSRLKPYLGEI
ncbi:MAG: hypothetical protein QM639_13995 [Rhodocyclaceae bacterium]